MKHVGSLHHHQGLRPDPAVVSECALPTSSQGVVRRHDLRCHEDQGLCSQQGVLCQTSSKVDRTKGSDLKSSGTAHQMLHHGIGSHCVYDGRSQGAETMSMSG